MKRSLRQTPTQRVLDQLELRIPHRSFISAMEMVARQLGVRFAGDIIPLPAAEIEDPSYPKGLKVLYRKFPCEILGDDQGGNCVSFDVIPVGVKGDPRRLRSYRSFSGSVEESEELFQDLLRFLRKIVLAVDRHQRL